ncbi:tyrosine-type recombinase/integrase [Alicyclobacillus fastidiosus]|uniref:Tyrosine-type recombinase/integrase n=1 Tax=Alicyclobacillus fastidiosus TaxID=392011 RepID=A0ABY6ZG18_9BACL|nr:tyrosine-type recombinase/integrase [Alicyclobacillus fastidiosus]WAH41807.1 tyrosine-type recombinase/integrase [Alicyclobacillus fastidiosus]WAH41814.1 tyrosine-type recombinase/integrase [Alicyclobacillus fastidiosus]GMA63505.1 tyrosine recombinase XerC [Alicyclobacillus fastidiosus]GMA63512.1 tyrosine recombinase XerC [Alicyclobacillus fastidiosus]
MIAHEAVLLFTDHLLTAERSQKTVIGYQSDLRNFERFYERKYNGPWYVEDTTREDVEEYIAFLKHDRGLGPATRNRILFGIRSFFRFLIQKEICSVNVADHMEPVRYAKRERMHVPEDNLEPFIAHISHPVIQAAAYTLFYTGLRISECVNLTMQNVDFASNCIRVINGKGKKNRTVPIADKLFPILDTYRETYRSHATAKERFFATETTGRLSPSYFNHVLFRTSQSLGMEKVTAHMLRHSFATSLVQRGVNVVQIQKLLGHSSLTVTSVYTHATLDDLSQAVNRL